jgi:FkbM family methyltransferase
MEEYCPALLGAETEKPCHLGMRICLDDFPKLPASRHTTATTTTTTRKKRQEDKQQASSPAPPCVIYDFGIREEPEFGLILSQEPFHCEVHGFDPSPISKQWYTSNKRFAPEARANPSYHFHPYGGGGADESIALREYNWDQVSVYQYPQYVTNGNNCSTQGKCRYHKFIPQKKTWLPVQTVQSVMKELNHTHIDILKLDVEGWEYRMLEALIESGVCRKVDQLTLEWHHYDIDLRYGESSVPMINVLVKLLQDECGLYQYWIHDATGWPSNEEIYTTMGIVLRYNIAAFKRKG